MCHLNQEDKIIKDFDSQVNLQIKEFFILEFEVKIGSMVNTLPKYTWIILG